MQATHHRRQITFGTLAMAFAILFGSLVPLNAHAEDNGGGRQGAVNQANDYVEACVANGGEPSIDAPSGFSWIEVSCDLGDITDYCFYYYDGARSCGQYDRALTPPNPGIRPPVVTGVDAAAQPSASGSSSSGSEESGPAVGASATDEAPQSVSGSDSGNEDEGETVTKTKNKKGKNGKKGGKHRKR